MSLGPAPSKETAHAFAVMLSSGAPPGEAIRYFLPEDTGEIAGEAFLQSVLSSWMNSKLVQNEIRLLQGADWTEMTSDQKIRFSIEKHYTEMAYFLYSRNYAELEGPAKLKADTCRVALEAKLAGMAGKLSVVEQFWLDVQSGKVKLAPSPAH